MRRYLPLLTLALLLVPALVSAAEQEFVPLVGIPGLDPDNSTFEGYVNTLFTLAIGIAAVLAVIKLIMAGVQYMFSEIPSVKSDAKGDIVGAILGLLIILGSITILNTINTDLTNLNVFENAEPIQVNSSSSATQESQATSEPIWQTSATSKSGADELSEECTSEGGTPVTTDAFLTGYVVTCNK